MKIKYLIAVTLSIIVLSLSLVKSENCGIYTVNPLHIDKHGRCSFYIGYYYLLKIPYGPNLTLYDINGYIKGNKLIGRLMKDSNVFERINSFYTNLKEGTEFELNLSTLNLKIKKGEIEIKDIPLEGKASLEENNDTVIAKGNFSYGNLKIEGTLKINKNGNVNLINGKATEVLSNIDVLGNNIELLTCKSGKTENWINFCNKSQAKGSLTLILPEKNFLIYKLKGGMIEIKDNLVNIEGNIEQKNGKQLLDFDKGKIWLRSNDKPKSDIITIFNDKVMLTNFCFIYCSTKIGYYQESEKGLILEDWLSLNYHIKNG